MTLAHVAALHFEGRADAAKKRVQKLKAAGYISERPRRVYEPSILSLTRHGYETLKRSSILDRYPALSPAAIEKRRGVSEITLRHELEVMDVKAALSAAVRQTDRFQIAEFSTWPLLYEFRAFQPDGTAVTVKPDGFIRVQEETREGLFERTFFLEVDRSTESQETLAAKACCYRDFYRRGGLAERHGRSRSEYEAFPFRVLMILRNTERRNNTAERLLTLTPPVLSQVWLTTFAEVTSNPLAAIWVRPSDYRDVISGSAFDLARTDSLRVYRRQLERDRLVEQQIVKRAFLVDP
jgi:hypothetical protein